MISECKKPGLLSPRFCPERFLKVEVNPAQVADRRFHRNLSVNRFDQLDSSQVFTESS